MNGRSVAVVATVLLVACSCSPNGPKTEPTSSVDPAPNSTADAGSETAAGTDQPAPATVATTSPSAPTTTAVLKPGVVALDGSVEAVLAELPEARNFATGVASWLDAVPGQEGVLRNDRGITLFVPVDAGFSEADRDVMVDDADVAAVIISDHLHVGALETLDGSVMTASGTEHTVTVDDGGSLIAGRRVVGSVAATNGVVYLIDGPLPAAG